MPASILVSFAFLVLSAAPAAAQIVLPPVVDDGGFGPLLSGNVYLAPDGIRVPDGATLTIQPDVIVKFEQNRELVVQGTGRLRALGTLAQPISLTSLRDDSLGGSTDPLDPAPGDWRGVEYSNGSQGNELRAVRIRYAGNQPGALELSRNTDVVVEDCIIELSGHAGMTAAENRTVVVRNTVFRDNLGRAATQFHLDALAGFTGNSASGNGGGDSVFVSDGRSFATLALGPEHGLGGVIVLEDDLRVDSGAQLSLRAGLIVKMAPSPIGTRSELRIIGDLRTQGLEGQPVVFTSVFDDEHGGDALADGDTQGAPGDWRPMVLTGSTTGSSLVETLVRFGGLAGPGISVQAPSASLYRVAVESCAGDALNVSGAATVKECRFDHNGGRALGVVSWFDLPSYVDNTAQGNGGGDYTEVDGGFFTSGFARIFKEFTLNGSGVIVTAELTVLFDASVGLILGPGLIVKFSTAVAGFNAGSGSLVFDGRGYDPIVLTSFRDDVYGGDTNGDGAATHGAPGDWLGVRYPNGASNAQMNFSYLRFPGAGGTPGVLGDSDALSYDQVRVDQSAGHGFVLNEGFGCRNLVAFVNLGDGFVLGGPGLLHATSAANFGRGIVKPDELEISLKACISWFNANGGSASQNVVGFDEQRLFNCNGSPVHAGVDGNFVADPQFADPDQGDLGLGLFSPCIGTGGGPNEAFTYLDFAGNSRVLDHNLFGFALPDMGAYEYWSYEMQIEGQPRLGKRLQLRIEGQEFQGNPPGLALLYYGFSGYNGLGVFFPPYGNMLINSQVFPVFLLRFPTQVTLNLDVPDDPSFVGLPANLQSLVFALGDLRGGNWATPMYATLRH